MTIMQRWQSVKSRIQAAVPLANAAALEAADIIRQQCGQTLYFTDRYFIQPQNDGVWVKWSKTSQTFFFEKNGNWRDGIGRGNRPVIEQHWPTSLAAAEEFADDLEKVTTGNIIAQWESMQ